MAEKEKLTLEERLAKATECYKELKTKFDEKEEELKTATERIKVLESQPKESSQGGNEKLLERIKELEDEITINGNSSEEIKALNTRLDKAKEVFAEQKEKISKLNDEVQKLTAELEGKVTQLTTAYNDIDRYSKAVEKVQQIIAGL